MIPIIINKGNKMFLILGKFRRVRSFAVRFANSIHSGLLEDTLQENQARDLVRFPRPQRAEFPGQVRLGFIPEEWFNFFYHKTGVTGPYIITLGIATLLVSKELYVLDHNFFNGVSMAATTTVAVKIIGPHIAAYADKRIELVERQYKENHQEVIRQFEEAILHERREQWRAAGQLLLLDAKRITVAIQLEAEYRERVMDAYIKVKQHLEWELEQERVLRALAHKHMVQWVRIEVGHSIVSRTFDKRFMKQCIEELVSIAQTKETFKQDAETSSFKLQ